MGHTHTACSTPRLKLPGLILMRLIECLHSGWRKFWSPCIFKAKGIFLIFIGQSILRIGGQGVTPNGVFKEYKSQWLKIEYLHSGWRKFCSPCIFETKDFFLIVIGQNILIIVQGVTPRIFPHVFLTSCMCSKDSTKYEKTFILLIICIYNRYVLSD